LKWKKQKKNKKSTDLPAAWCLMISTETNTLNPTYPYWHLNYRNGVLTWINIEHYTYIKHWPHTICHTTFRSPITEEYNSYTSSIDLRVCSTFISIPITEEYNSSTNDQSWEDQANADINLLQQILRRAWRTASSPPQVTWNCYKHIEIKLMNNVQLGNA
jgi:hypothetical protein